MSTAKWFLFIIIFVSNKTAQTEGKVYRSIRKFIINSLHRRCGKNNNNKNRGNRDDSEKRFSVRASA